jgi:hypothetical protein
MIYDNWKVQILDSPGKAGKDIYIYCNNPDGTTDFLVGNKIEKIKELGVATDKCKLFLNTHILQELSDALNESGFKPQKGYLEGKLEATERHLEDIRKVAKLTP